MGSDWRKDARTTTQRGYGWRWQQARSAYLAVNTLCRMCATMTPPRLTPATVVDHVIKHEGDVTLFWDPTNWQPLCKPCHDSRKQRQEKSGRPSVQIGEDGFPV